MPLQELDLEVDDRSLPEPVERWIEAARDRISAYWDQFPQRPLPQFVECDFQYVGRALQLCMERQLIDGRLFIEWGAGFAVVTGIAGLLGLEAIGVEAEQFLCEQARGLMDGAAIQAEVWHGNFLPDGAHHLAEDEDPVVSLGYDIAACYEQQGLQIDDFAIVFAYPWPGEEHFLRLVFERYARVGAVLLMYRGPYHIELYRKH